jgi:hypothetical protein
MPMRISPELIGRPTVCGIERRSSRSSPQSTGF